MFHLLLDQPVDQIFALINAVSVDKRRKKIDLGIGVYRDASGSTPVMRAVKMAERIILETQMSKSYLGPEGDPAYVQVLRDIIFGSENLGDRLLGIQTPGGTGALRLGGELICSAKRGARIWIGIPSWPNHASIFSAAGLEVREYVFADLANQSLDFSAALDALDQAVRDDFVLLHGCCHNPTGMDLSADQWREALEIISRRGLIPFIDLAYHGLGTNLDVDVDSTRMILNSVERAILSYSCDKNFGLYRERVGALYVLSSNKAEAVRVMGNLKNIVRANWSMPPDHGACIVRTILERPALAADWRAELECMRERIVANRAVLANCHPALEFVRLQRGMFSNLAVSPTQVNRLRFNHAVYVSDSGRINFAGMQPFNADAIIMALASEGCIDLTL